MHRWLVVLLLFSGCAFGLSGPDPDRPRSKAPECDTGKGLVVLDGMAAATAGVIAMSLAGENEPAIALVPLAIGSLYLAGAISGNNSVNKCRKAMGEYESYFAGHDPEDTRRPATTPAEPTSVAAAPAPAPIAVPATPAMTTQPAVPTAAAPPAPPVAKPATKPAAKPAPAPAKQDDDWADFWQEVE